MIRYDQYYKKGTKTVLTTPSCFSRNNRKSKEAELAEYEKLIRELGYRPSDD